MNVSYSSTSAVTTHQCRTVHTRVEDFMASPQLPVLLYYTYLYLLCIIFVLCIIYPCPGRAPSGGAHRSGSHNTEEIAEIRYFAYYIILSINTDSIIGGRVSMYSTGPGAGTGRTGRDVIQCSTFTGIDLRAYSSGPPTVFKRSVLLSARSHLAAYVHRTI